jgi:hypothetical protein
VELSTARNATSCVDTREPPRNILNLKVHCRIYKRSPLVLILSKINLVRTALFDLFKIHLTHLCFSLRSARFLSVFLTNNLYAFLFFPIHATWPSHPILLDLNILIILGEEYKSWSSLLRSFLQSPVTSSLFGPNIIFCNLFSVTFSLCSSLNVRSQVSQPYRTVDKI